jgi:hypothetical protein
MELVLSIGDKVLDRIPLKAELTGDDEYMTAMQRLLLVKHELAIIAHQQDPIFYIEASSGMGKQKLS